MGTQLLADIANVLTKQFDPALKRQFNRRSVLAALLPKKNGAGANLNWGARFSRSVHAAKFTEGADVAAGEINQDVDQNAVLGWAMYRVAFGMSGISIAAARSALQSPDALLELFEGHLTDAATDLISQINAALYSGDGSASEIAGLYGSGALAATGSYAGLSRVTYPEWASNVLGNGAVPRALTKSLLDQLEQQIFDACGMPPDVIVASSGVVRKYEALFDSVVRTEPAAGAGAELSVIGRLAGNSGATGLFYKGIPVVRDRNATAGKLSMLNTDFAGIRSLPHVDPGMAVTPSKDDKGLTDGVVDTGINAKVEPLAKTGDSNKFQLVSYLQLQVRRPNTCGVLEDIDES